jgi:hypothetical protein
MKRSALIKESEVFIYPNVDTYRMSDEITAISLPSFSKEIETLI